MMSEKDIRGLMNELNERLIFGHGYNYQHLKLIKADELRGAIWVLRHILK